jgi:hypothetical protein
MRGIQEGIGFTSPRILLALVLLAGASCERRQQGTAGENVPSAGVEPESTAASGARTTPTPRIGGPDLAYAVVAPEISEETPVVQRRVPTAAGRPTFLRNDTLYAAADDLVPILSAGARVRLGSDRVVVANGRELPVRGLDQNGVVYVPVKAFARHFGAYTLTNEVDGSATIWPRDVLIYWKKHGPGNSPVLQGAAAEGLLPP